MSNLEKFPARSPLVVLQRLVEARVRDRAPAVDVFTVDGHCFSGWAVKLEAERGGQPENLLLQGMDSSGRPSEDLVYLSVARIAAVRVQAGGTYARVLSFGELGFGAGETGPSRLELKREFQSVSEKLQTELRLTLTLEAGDAIHLTVRAIARAMPAAIAPELRDEVGRQAWTKIRALQIGHATGATLGARREGDVLRLTGDLTRALPEPLAAGLNVLLNSLL